MLMRIMANPNGNYLRARGEYVAHLAAKSGIAELPPRTRRIRCALGSQIRDSGTTSAHAENTWSRVATADLARNYLRARGEYSTLVHDVGDHKELPPRTRRIHIPHLILATSTGTTSAHAENTASRRQKNAYRRNYLRARGEYRSKPSVTSSKGELPPRTRRIPMTSPINCSKYGTTSAHAENTLPVVASACTFRNYLRARGEYDAAISFSNSPWELPPRTRRIRVFSDQPGIAFGTTSAHAENTFIPVVHAKRRRNYLRARGEYPKSAGSFITWFSKMGQI